MFKQDLVPVSEDILFSYMNFRRFDGIYNYVCNTLIFTMKFTIPSLSEQFFQLFNLLLPTLPSYTHTTLITPSLNQLQFYFDFQHHVTSITTCYLNTPHTISICTVVLWRKPSFPVWTCPNITNNLFRYTIKLNEYWMEIMIHENKLFQIS